MCDCAEEEDDQKKVKKKEDDTASKASDTTEGLADFSLFHPFASHKTKTSTSTTIDSDTYDPFSPVIPSESHNVPSSSRATPDYASSYLDRATLHGGLTYRDRRKASNVRVGPGRAVLITGTASSSDPGPTGTRTASTAETATEDKLTGDDHAYTSDWPRILPYILGTLSVICTIQLLYKNRDTISNKLSNVTELLSDFKGLFNIKSFGSFGQGFNSLTNFGNWREIGTRSFKSITYIGESIGRVGSWSWSWIGPVSGVSSSSRAWGWEHSEATGSASKGDIGSSGGTRSWSWGGGASATGAGSATTSGDTGTSSGARARSWSRSEATSSASKGDSGSSGGTRFWSWGRDANATRAGGETTSGDTGTSGGSRTWSWSRSETTGSASKGDSRSSGGTRFWRWGEGASTTGAGGTTTSGDTGKSRSYSEATGSTSKGDSESSGGTRFWSWGERASTTGAGGATTREDTGKSRSHSEATGSTSKDNSESSGGTRSWSWGGGGSATGADDATTSGDTGKSSSTRTSSWSRPEATDSTSKGDSGSSGGTRSWSWGGGGSATGADGATTNGDTGKSSRTRTSSWSRPEATGTSSTDDSTASGGTTTWGQDGGASASGTGKATTGLITGDKRLTYPERTPVSQTSSDIKSADVSPKPGGVSKIDRTAKSDDTKRKDIKTPKETDIIAMLDKSERPGEISRSDTIGHKDSAGKTMELNGTKIEDLTRKKRRIGQPSITDLSKSAKEDRKQITELKNTPEKKIMSERKHSTERTKGARRADTNEIPNTGHREERPVKPNSAEFKDTSRSLEDGTEWKDKTGIIGETKWKKGPIKLSDSEWKDSTRRSEMKEWKDKNAKISKTEVQKESLEPSGAEWKDVSRRRGGIDFKDGTGIKSGAGWKDASEKIVGAEWKRRTTIPGGIEWKDKTGKPGMTQWKDKTETTGTSKRNKPNKKAIVTVSSQIRTATERTLLGNKKKLSKGTNRQIDEGNDNTKVTEMAKSKARASNWDSTNRGGRASCKDLDSSEDGTVVSGKSNTEAVKSSDSDATGTVSSSASPRINKSKYIYEPCILECKRKWSLSSIDRTQ